MLRLAIGANELGPAADGHFRSKGRLLSALAAVRRSPRTRSRIARTCPRHPIPQHRSSLSFSCAQLVPSPRFLEAGLAREGINNRINNPDFAILEALLHKGRLTISDIEQKVHLTTAPLNLAIDRLKRRGMVRAHSDRSHPGFELTEDGRERISRIYARHTEDIGAVMNVLSPEERRPLWQALKKIGIQGARCQHARSRDRRGGLAPWQVQRATEYMTEHLIIGARAEEMKWPRPVRPDDELEQVLVMKLLVQACEAASA
jgi:MarR family transcriptional regulator, 2-MHQ and catechol-resistance regulon repressor